MLNALVWIALFSFAAVAAEPPEALLMVTQYPAKECSTSLAGSQLCNLMAADPKLVLWVHVRNGVGTQVEIDAEVNGKQQVYVIKVPDQKGEWSAVTFRVRDTVLQSEFRILRMTAGSITVDNPEYGTSYK